MKIKKFANSSLINWICKLKKKGYSVLILICGQQRSGKSMTSLCIAEALKLRGIVNFDIEKDLKHSVEDFIKWHLDGNTNRLIITDEAESVLNASEFWSNFNIAYEKIISTQMYLGNIYIVILPMAMRLSKSNRRFVDIKIEMINKGVCKWNRIIKYHGNMGFNPKWRSIIETPTISIINLPRLPSEIVEAYKKIEKDDKKKILENIAKNIGIDNEIDLKPVKINDIM